MINTFPRVSLPYFENELIPLIKAYPAQLETHINVVVQQLIMNYVDFRDYPPLDSNILHVCWVGLKAIHKRRQASEFTFLLSAICKNYLIMKMVGELKCFEVDCRFHPLTTHDEQSSGNIWVPVYFIELLGSALESQVKDSLDDVRARADLHYKLYQIWI